MNPWRPLSLRFCGVERRPSNLRCKATSACELSAASRRIRSLMTDPRTLLIINDRMDVALVAKAHGVHLGPDDLPLAVARKIAPKGFLIGSSVDTAEEARRAESGRSRLPGGGPCLSNANERNDQSRHRSKRAGRDCHGCLHPDCGDRRDRTREHLGGVGYGRGGGRCCFLGCLQRRSRSRGESIAGRRRARLDRKRDIAPPPIVSVPRRRLLERPFDNPV